MPNTFETIMGWILWIWMWAILCSGFIALGYVFYDIIRDCKN